MKIQSLDVPRVCVPAKWFMFSYWQNNNNKKVLMYSIALLDIWIST